MIRFIGREGPCFYLSLLEFYPQTRPGRSSGLRIDIWYPDDEVIPAMFNAFYQDGIYVYDYHLSAALSSNPTIVGLGMYQLQQFYANHHINVPEKESPCIDVKKEKSTLKYFSEYR